MKARWTRKRISAPQFTVRYALRAGAKGKGRELGAVTCWPDSGRSMDEADRICNAIEQRAIADGYEVLSEED